MEISKAPRSNVEQLLTNRLDQYTIGDVSRALENGNVDPTVAIKVVALKPDEEVNGVLIRDSGAVVAPKTRVNAHLHTGGEDLKTRLLNGLEMYKILGGEGEISLGYPMMENSIVVKNEDGSVKVQYDDPVAVRTGSIIKVEPGQVHSLRNTSETENLTFVFTGSPDHLSNIDRIMVSNPSEQKASV